MELSPGITSRGIAAGASSTERQRANADTPAIVAPGPWIAFQPWRPTRTIAAQDIYAHTRNPMYQGFMLLALGLAVVLRSDGGVLMLMPAAMLIHYGVVLREESYLERRFGEGYLQYKAAVPRYGWPFSLQARPKP
jgi:protein-S-isoprenylcysteine O-methyltransferase Ste14